MQIVFEEIKCDICGSKDFKKIYQIKDTLTYFENPFDLVRCHNCELVFISPRPAGEAMIHFYPEDFVAYQMEYQDAALFDVKRKLVNFVSLKIANQRVDILRKHVNMNKNISLLDFGCGAGEFLMQVRQKFSCSVLGVDFAGPPIEKCKLKGVECFTVEEFENKNFFFDVVTLWHVLEHTSSPNKLLQDLQSKMKQSGVLFIVVPNWNSLENKIFKARSFLLDPPRHLYQFSEETITHLLEKNGFEVQSIDYIIGEGGWLGSVQNILLQGKLFKDFYKNIWGIMILSLLVFPLELISVLVRKGSVLSIVAKKIGKCELKSELSNKF